jgi:hypothetical protein
MALSLPGYGTELEDLVQQALLGGVPLKGYSTVSQGWIKFEVPGQPLIIINPRFGKLVIGMHPSGKFDQWVFEEVNGGGVISFGYHVDENGKLWVATLAAPRFNLIGEYTDIEAAGGFHDGNTAALPDGVRETLEEIGLMPEDPFLLPGRLFTGNRGFGFLGSEQLGTKVIAYKLKGVQRDLLKSDKNALLMPWGKSVRMTRDGLTGMGLARLRAYLDGEYEDDEPIWSNFPLVTG